MKPSEKDISIYKVFMMEAFQGNESAVMFMMDILDLIHTWDDLIDKDKECSNDEISSAFKTALIRLPLNSFYATYQVHLLPVLNSCIMQWEASNELEVGSQRDKDKAYMLRASYYQLIHYCAYLIGGEQWAKEIGSSVYKLYGETKEGYLKEVV